MVNFMQAAQQAQQWVNELAEDWIGTNAAPIIFCDVLHYVAGLAVAGRDGGPFRQLPVLIAASTLAGSPTQRRSSSARRRTSSSACRRRFRRSVERPGRRRDRGLQPARPPRVSREIVQVRNSMKKSLRDLAGGGSDVPRSAAGGRKLAEELLKLHPANPWCWVAAGRRSVAVKSPAR